MAVNEFEKQDEINKNNYEILLKLLSPFAPHISEELWSMLGNKGSIHAVSWPIADETKFIEISINIMIQVNGKVRGFMKINRVENEESIKNMAMNKGEIKKWIMGKEIKKVIFIKDKVVNIVF